MKRLMLLLAFLISVGTSAFGQLVKEVTLSFETNLSATLGEDAAKVTTLKISGPLTEADFTTMKNDMAMLQVLDMSGVTSLPKYEYWENDVHYAGQCIPYFSFAYKQTLRQICLPTCVEAICQEAFRGCSYLTSVDFSNATSLKYIHNSAFSECAALKSLDLSNCPRLVNIRAAAFFQCVLLETVNLSGCSSLHTIETDAFAKCISLYTVQLTGCTRLKEIGNYAFSDSENLENFDFLQLTNLESIGIHAFYHTSIKGILSFPLSLKYLKEGAFLDCEKITSIDLRNSNLAVIPADVFSGCSSLLYVDFDGCESLNTLDNKAFSNCSCLKEIFIDNGFYQSINGILYDVDINNLILYPSGKDDVGYAIPGSVLTIQSSAFPYNKNLKTLTIPESVKSIQPDAFLSEQWGPYPSYTVIMEAETPIGLSSNIGLNSAIIYVPKGALNTYKEAAIWKDYTLIETGAEGTTVALETAGSLGAKLTELGVTLNTIQELTVTGPMNVSDFEVIKQMNLLTKADLSGATMEENRLPNYAFNSRTEPQKLSCLKEVVLPEGIIAIGEYAFAALYNLEKVNLPTSLESIGSNAFDHCTRLQEIDLFSLEHLRSIGWCAFQNCSAIPTTLKLPNTIDYIDGYAFAYTNVTSVNLSNTAIHNIGPSAFADCAITGELSFPATLTYIFNDAFNAATPTSIKLKSAEIVRLGGTDVFNATDKTTCKVYVPKGLGATYKADTYWSPFGDNIEEYGYFVETSVNNSNYGSVNGGGAYNEGETVVLTAQTYLIDSGWYSGYAAFAGWYENGQQVSADLTYSFVMDEADHSIEARFFIPRNMISGNTIITDENKYDGQSVRVWYDAKLTIQGDNAWKPNEFMVDRNASMLVESTVEAQSVNMYWERYSSNWQFVSFPYNLKVSDIQMDGYQFVVREYDGDVRALKGMGESWKQLNASDVMQANKGYILRSNGTPASSSETYNSSIDDMNKLFNRSAVTIPLEKHTSNVPADANWNLVGNPFPCYFSVEQLFDAGLDGTVTVWSDDIQNYEYYTKDDQDVYLAPLTAFFIQHNQAASVTFNPEGRAATLPTTRAAVADLRSDAGREVINLLLANDSLSDKTRVVFNEAASTDYELGKDAAKFSSMNNNAPSLYTLDAQNQQLAINERPVGNGVVRLGCYIGVKGSYTLSAKEALASDLYLYDTETGASCNLRETSYTFIAEAGACNNRFELRTSLKGTGIAAIEGFSWQVAGSQLLLNGLPTGATVSLFDANGRMLFTGDAATATQGIALPQSGIYYLTIRTAEGVSSTVSIKR